jgi:hypothetical protein
MRLGAFVFLLLASGALAQPAQHTGRTVLVVELSEVSDERIDARCGPAGFAHLPVHARVVALEEGAWPHTTIVLGWPVCGGTLRDWGVAPGQRYRVRVRVGRDLAPDRPRHVRWSEPLP